MTRTRNFAFVVYPDSAPQNWVQLLDDMHIQSFISPLHDSDFNQSVPPEPKKPHYHVIIMFDSVKTLDQAREVGLAVGCANGVVDVVSSLRGYARYLCHLDNPDKALYNPEMVTCLCGSDYFDVVNLPSDKYSAVGDMMDFCRREHLTSFSDLCDYARLNREDWFRLLCDKVALIMKEYLKSLHWTEKEAV